VLRFLFVWLVLLLDDLALAVVWVVGCCSECVVVCVVVECVVVRGGVVVSRVVRLFGWCCVSWYGLPWRGRGIGILVGGGWGNDAKV
jgi:hypothetical protein